MLYSYIQVEWTIPAFTPQPQSITALWLVLISRPTEGRRLSWRKRISLTTQAIVRTFRTLGKAIGCFCDHDLINVSKDVLVSFHCISCWIFIKRYSSSNAAPFCIALTNTWQELQTFYRQHCAKRKARVFNLLRGRFWGFFAPHERQVAPMGVKFGIDEGTKGLLLHANFHPIGATVRV